MASQVSLFNIVNQLRSLADTMEVIPTVDSFPSYNELKSSPDFFYNCFSKATYNYNVICDALQKLQHGQAMIIKLVNDLNKQSGAESYSQKSSIIKDLSNLRSEYIALISCYETAKSSAELTVKFYNSAQYFITSPRFENTHANF